MTLSNRSTRPGPACAVILSASLSLASAQEILLWPTGAPGAKGALSTDKPSITPFPASRPNGAAMVIFPGGAYAGLASDHEGQQPAKWLAGLGVSAFVVKYRLGAQGYRHPIEMGDGQRAIRWVRANAARYGIDTARVGVMGFSAGGHMASTVSTHFDGGDPSAADSIERHGCRPGFSVLGYPVITMDRTFTHLQSRENLIGTNPSQGLVDSLSNEKQVTAKTPPGFLFHSTDDNVVKIKNSIVYYDSLLKRGVAAKMMTFDHGGHGYGMADGKGGAPNDPALHIWTDTLVKWLDARGFLSRTVSLAAPAPRMGAARKPGMLLESADGRGSDALGRRPSGGRLPQDRRLP